MEKLHAHLLGLLREIDAICKKYEITYYAAGGTTIGVVRHQGFIPWDDDADLYMTRENFYRFREAFHKEAPRDRVLECLDDNRECPATIPRYIEETTTTLCRFHCMNTCSGGLIIDIFILDPIPADKEIQEAHLAKFNVYNDIVVPYYVYSHRNEAKYYGLYDTYQKKLKEQGREAVLHELEAELFQYREEECDCYVLRWGTLPSIFPKDMMGDPVYLPFEDMQLPLPNRWWDYLYQLYGADWMYIPGHEEATQHVSVVNMDVPYTVYTAELDQQIDKKEAAENYQLRKDLTIKRNELKREWEQNLLQVNIQYVKYIQNKMISENGYDILELLDKKKFSEIVDIFDYYLKNQCVPEFLGKMRHSYWHRYRKPVFIDIDDEWLYALLYALTAKGQIKKAESLLRARRGTGKALSSLLEKIDELFSNIKCLSGAYYSGRAADAQKALKCLSAEDRANIISIKRLELLVLIENASEEQLSSLVSVVQQALEQYPADAEIEKAYGDLLFRQGKKDEAKQIYQKILGRTSNGMLLLDIKNKFSELVEDTDVNTTESGEEHVALTSFQQVQFKLLCEINEICEKHGIEYFLYGDTAIYAYYGHAFKKDYGLNTVMMTAENAMKFMDAVTVEGRTDRRIDSMLTNADHFAYDLYYADQNTLYFPIAMQDNERYANLGIFIRIKIVKKKHSKIKAAIIRGLEIAHESYLMYLPETAEKKARYVHKFGNAIMKLCGKQGRKKIAETIFRWHTQAALNSRKEECFVTRKNKNLKHKNWYFSEKLFESKENVSLYDRKFPVLALQVQDKRIQGKGAGQEKRKLVLLADAHLTFSELKQNVDLDLLTGEALSRYKRSLEYREFLVPLNKTIQRYWAIVCRIDDKFKMQDHFSSQKKQILDLYNCKKYDKVMGLLEEYDELVRYYQSYKLAFSFDEEIFEIYCGCLEALGNKSRAERVRELKHTELRLS